MLLELQILISLTVNCKFWVIYKKYYSIYKNTDFTEKNEYVSFTTYVKKFLFKKIN